MSNLPESTIVGNLVRDPELRFTSNATAVASLTLAVTPRVKDQHSGEWTDGEPLFMPVTVWRQQAEHVADSLNKGDRVIVRGRLRENRWEKDGEKRSRIELVADDIGPSLQWATAKPNKASRRTETTNSGALDPWAANNSPTAGSDPAPASEPPF